MARAPILVPCLVTLRREFDLVAPKRDRKSDGWLGDLAHRQERSDHNPDDTPGVLTPYTDTDTVPEVHAIDVDSDLNTPDMDMQHACDIIRVRHMVGEDDRLQNIIYNRHITSRSWGWKAWHPYTGQSAHTEHAHFSSRYLAMLEADTRPFGLLAAIGDDMATISQDDFNARMDAWWNARMSPNAKDNTARSALRVAPWQQEVGHTGISTHNELFGTMKSSLDSLVTAVEHLTGMVGSGGTVPDPNGAAKPEE